MRSYSLIGSQNGLTWADTALRNRFLESCGSPSLGNNFGLLYFRELFTNLSRD